MSRDYLPGKQQELRDFLKAAAAHLVGDPSRFDLMQDEAQSFSDRVDEFSDAMDLILDPATRNVTTIEGKNLKKIEMLQLVRPMLKRIRDNAGVALEDKRALGLRDPDAQPTLTPVPSTIPVLAINAATPLVHTVRYHDVNSPESKSRPAGVAALQLFRTVNPATPPTSPDDADFVAVVTRQSFGMQYDSALALKTIYYWARWQNSRGQVGPWSEVAVKAVAA